MVKCLLCGKEFKNEAGLDGHMRLVHPSASTVDGHKLEERLSALEVLVEEQTKLTGRLIETIGDMSKIVLEDRDNIRTIAEYLVKGVKE